MQLFYAVTTQWRYAGMSGARTGLDYTAVAARANTLPQYRSLNPLLKDCVWQGLQRMEMTALKQWQQQK